MNQRMLAGLLAIGGSLPGCVAVPPTPVCAEPGVLRQLYETLHRQGRPLVFEAPPVGEVSTGLVPPRYGSADTPAYVPADVPLAQCAVRGHTVAYDTNRYGASPVHESFIVHYTVEPRHNGLFVSVQ